MGVVVGDIVTEAHDLANTVPAGIGPTGELLNFNQAIVWFLQGQRAPMAVWNPDLTTPDAVLSSVNLWQVPTGTKKIRMVYFKQSGQTVNEVLPLVEYEQTEEYTSDGVPHSWAWKDSAGTKYITFIPNPNTAATAGTATVHYEYYLAEVSALTDELEIPLQAKSALTNYLASVFAMKDGDRDLMRDLIVLAEKSRDLLTNDYIHQRGPINSMPTIFMGDVRMDRFGLPDSEV